MRVIHVPFCFYPDVVGGTEIYVEALARQQQGRGCSVLVAAPADHPGAYEQQGLRVLRFPVAAVADPAQLYDDGDALAADAFARIIEDERPHLVHLHAFTRGVSLRLMRAAKATGVPVVFTYHTPTVSCLRGTLMRWGSDPCDGRLDLDLCTRCTLQGLGLSRPVAAIAGRVPVGVGQALGSARLAGGAWTALRMRALAQARHTAVRALLEEVDHVVAVAAWVRALLVLNGVAPSKVTVSRQGLSQDLHGRAPRQRSHPASGGAPLRLAFVGRLHPTKGAHVLLQAIRATADLPLALDVYGITQGPADAAYLQYLQRLAGADPRIRFHPPLPSGDVVERLSAYDLVAVPSQWLESGPLVVLEAFAAGVPVLGSNLGGIAELVEHDVNGLLVPPDAVEAWSAALRSLCAHREMLDRWCAGIRPPRTMTTVADEMVQLYRTLGVV